MKFKYNSHDKSILFSFDNSSEELREEIKAHKQHCHFSRSSIYNSNSLSWSSTLYMDQNVCVLKKFKTILKISLKN